MLSTLRLLCIHTTMERWLRNGYLAVKIILYVAACVTVPVTDLSVSAASTGYIRPQAKFYQLFYCTAALEFKRTTVLPGEKTSFNVMPGPK